MLCVPGIIAIIFSVLASSAADDGDMDAARTRGKVSLAMSIVGILSTIIAVIACVLYFVVFVSAAVDAACSGHNYC